MRPEGQERIRLEMPAPGILDDLAVVPADRRPPGPGELEIRVEAVGLNFREVMKALGVYPGAPDPSAQATDPITFDGDVAGTIAAVGAGVRGWRVGDAVMAFGADVFSSFATVPAFTAAPKPPALSFPEAATVPIGFLTAHYALNHAGRLARGERVLIHAAAGGVGLAAVQLAQRAGAEVFATAGSPRKRQFLQDLGVRHVFDSRTLSFAGEIRQATGGIGVDVVLNSLAGEFLRKSLTVLAPFGRFLEIGRRDIYEDLPLGLFPFRDNLSFHAIDLQQMTPTGIAALVREVMGGFERGELRPLPLQVLPLASAVEAFRLMRKSRHIGKIVLSLGDGAAPADAGRAPAATAAAPGVSRPPAEPIAVIGLGCRFPGADGPEAFWSLLREGRDAVTEMPKRRRVLAGLDDQPATLPGDPGHFPGAFLDDPDAFDADFFGISRGEAERMDPQQRLLLEVTWEALESAGLAGNHPAKARCGAFIGIASCDYGVQGLQDIDRINAYSLTGSLASLAVNRLSYTFDLRGPSLAVDTACSSSLVAVHLACRSLASGETDLALAGGVNLVLLLNVTAAMAHAWILSESGRCRSFDSEADGYVRGEGCGLVVLKRLSDAMADGDPILAVIRGTAVNQDGRGPGLTNPDARAQQAVIRAALDAAGMAPEEVGYVEAHGVGSARTDAVEAEALAAVFGDCRTSPPYLGSVKTNIGHLEAASGIAALIKAVLCLQHREIPAHLHFRQLNPEIDPSRFPFRFPRECCPWAEGAGPRAAGVNSFGIGGTNVHVVLTEPATPPATPLPANRPIHLLALSAKTPEALGELAGRVARFCDSRPDAFLPDLCSSINTGRPHFPWRMAVVADSIEQLRVRLDRRILLRRDGHPVAPPPAAPPRVALLLGGSPPSPRDVAEQLDAEPVLRDELLAWAGTPERRDALLRVLHHEEADPALGTAAAAAWQFALARRLLGWGVRPAIVAGRGPGALAAAALAGLLEPAQAGQLAELLVTPGDGPAVTALVAAEVKAVAAALGDCAPAVAVAATPGRCLVSGPAAPLGEVLGRLHAAGWRSRRLPGTGRPVWPLSGSALATWRAAAEATRPATPGLAIAGGRSGEDAEMAWRRLSGWAAGPGPTVMDLALPCGQLDVYLEVGGTDVVERRKWRQAGRSVRVATTGGYRGLLGAVATLYEAGAELDWSAVMGPGWPRRPITAPTYPFQRKRFWFRAGVPGGPDGAGDKSATPTVEQPEFLRRVANALPSARRGLILSHLRGEVSSVLGLLSPEALDVRTGFFELGMTSLMAIELHGRLQASLGVTHPLRSTLVFEHSTTAALAEYIARGVLNLEPTAGDAPGPRGDRDFESILAQIEQMPDDLAESWLGLRLRGLVHAAGGAGGAPAPTAGAKTFYQE